VEGGIDRGLSGGRYFAAQGDAQALDGRFLDELGRQTAATGMAKTIRLPILVLILWAATCAAAGFASDAQPAGQIPSPTPAIPSPVAPSEPPSGYLAPPIAPAGETPGDFAQIEADFLKHTFEDGKPRATEAEGKVVLRYKDITATAEHGRIDWKRDTAELQGNVVLRTGMQEARASSVVLNLKTREWSAVSPTTTITPEFARGYLKAPLFADGRLIQGRGRREIDLFDGKATTCDLPAPHYELVSRSLVVFPDNKAVLRDVKLYALGRHLITIPRLVIPLRDIQRNPNIIPRFGETQEEGVFLKTQYALFGSKTLASFLLLDFMSRKGFGKGLQQSWRLPNNAFGELYFYQLFDRSIDQNTVTGRLTHSQNFGTIRAAFLADFRSNSYLYAPQSSSILGQLSLTRDRPGASTSLVVNQNVNEAFVRTSRLAGNLKHRQQFGSATTLDADLDYTAYTSDQTRARLTSQVAFARQEKRFDWSLSAQKLTDLSDEAFVGRGQFGGIEKLPELGIITDCQRLGLGVPMRFKLTYGSYSELPSPIGLDRTYFEADTPVHRYDLSRGWTLGGGLGFKQYFYSDNTAQYSFDASTELARKLGPTSSFNLTYRYQRPRGFTPFRFDYVGRYNVANASLNYQDNEKFRLSLLTGYNFEQDRYPWQDVTIRFSVQPSPSFLLYTATAYDPNSSRWRTLINQIRIRAGTVAAESVSQPITESGGPARGFRLDIGTRYDTTLERLASARVVLDTNIGPKWRVQANAGYNGFTRTFDYRSIMLTRDLHCWEASLTYINQTGFYRNEGFSFSLRIKAFPFFRDFGAGAFGQTLDTSVGQVY